MACGAAAYSIQPPLAVVHGASAQQALLLLLPPVLLLLLIAIRLVSASAGGRRAATAPSSAEKRSGGGDDGDDAIDAPPPLPPSPPGGLPVIGHLHLVGAQPHVSLRDLAAGHGRGGLLLLRLGAAAPTVVASSPAAAEAVLRTHDHALASRARSAVADIIFHGASDVAFAPYGAYWRQARMLLTAHMLSARKVLSFRHGRREEAGLVVAKIRAAAASRTAAAAVDMSELLSAYSNDVVCRAVLGRTHRDGGRNRVFCELIEVNVSLLGGFNLEDFFPSLAMADVLKRVVCAKARRVSRRWDDLFDELIDEHARRSRSPASREEEESDADFIHVLLSLQEKYGLTRENIKAILLDMFQAGIETSYLVLEYAMAELMNNRDVMSRLQEEVRGCTPGGRTLDVVKEEDLGSMTYLRATIKETLRLHPPAPFLLPHLSTADCKVNGYLIPAGTRVIVNAWALGRDPSSWEKPEKFMPERFLQGGSSENIDMKGKDLQFVPFGSGRRICPGMNFGLSTVEIMLANLMYHFDWEVPDEVEGTNGEVDMTESFGLTLRRKQRLLLVPKLL
ncbi:hypothetical protein ACP4OV_018463 [Aristida adscensionis]